MTLALAYFVDSFLKLQVKVRGTEGWGRERKLILDSSSGSLHDPSPLSGCPLVLLVCWLFILTCLRKWGSSSKKTLHINPLCSLRFSVEMLKNLPVLQAITIYELSVFYIWDIIVEYAWGEQRIVLGVAEISSFLQREQSKAAQYSFSDPLWIGAGWITLPFFHLTATL